ncbi:uncharacterized protein LOC105698896 [Orussus abietinus]|uniref:uncharacterized protein LOC105698896 n=1 Tax=Orussus abietinus TaxID=222816 RepID=UPI000626D653|nr:uncharacterized protein LOC105698896 [Orussus abietinus]
MAHGVSEMLAEGSTVKTLAKHHQQAPHQPRQQGPQVPPRHPMHPVPQPSRKTVGAMGSRRIFAPAFKLRVLDSYRNDIDCRGNQRATARKYGIHRRQIQKWLQCEENLRSSCTDSVATAPSTPATTSVSTPAPSSASVPSPDAAEAGAGGGGVTPAAPALNLSLARLHGDEPPARQGPPPVPGEAPARRSPCSPRYGQPFRDPRSRTALQEDVDRGADPADRERKFEPTSPSGAYGSPSEVTEAFRQSLAQFRQEFYAGCLEEALDAAHRRRPRHRHRHRNYISDSDSNNNNGGGGNGARVYREAGGDATPAIKTEPASPDSAASPGPHDEPAAREAARAPVEPGPAPFSPPAPTLPTLPTLAGTTPTLVALPTSTVARFEPASPERTHGPSSADSEKPPRRRAAEPENGETSRRHAEEEEYRERGIPEADGDSDVGRGATIEGPRGSPRSPDSPTLLEEGLQGASKINIEAAYAAPLSPGSSARSSTSSDSEMDPLDYSSGSANPADLARRRSFSLRFKLDVLDAFHRDVGVAGNQRATARKFGINRRQVQKWLSQETELRGEIALRGGNSRQRLGPGTQESGGESAVDLRTSVSGSGPDVDVDSPSPAAPPRSLLYCCDLTSSSRLGYYKQVVDSTEVPSRCTLSCCADAGASCYQDPSWRRSCHPETRGVFYCYSPRDGQEAPSGHAEPPEVVSSSLKRVCTLSCCYEGAPSPKRICLDADDVHVVSSGSDLPPQEAPLCLVKPKRIGQASPLQVEPVTSTVPTPPAVPPAPSKKDAILFKPYLDNPIAKPADEYALPNNNNCHGICNLNEDRGHDYALELSLRMPVSWRTHLGDPMEPYTNCFPRVRSAFVRYPASPHYT